MKPQLKPPGTKHLKLKCDGLLSRFAFKFKLRRYNLVHAVKSSVAFAFSSAWWGGAGRPYQAHFESAWNSPLDSIT